MPELSAAANAILLSQWVLALTGIALTGAWFLAPKFQPLRRQPPLVPAWDAPLGDTLLVGWAACCAVFLGSMLAGSVTRHLGLAAGNGWISILSVLGFQGALVACLAAVAFYRRTIGRPLPPAGRTPPPPLVDRLLLGAAVFCGVLPFVYGASFVSVQLMQRLGWPVQLQDLAGLFASTDSPLLLLALTFMGVVVAPLGEEILFRAGLFRLCRRVLPRWAALLLSALAFATLHWNAVHFLPLAVLGIVFALAYEKTGSLLVPVVAHGLFNLNSILNLLAGVGVQP